MVKNKISSSKIYLVSANATLSNISTVINTKLNHAEPMQPSIKEQQDMKKPTRQTDADIPADKNSDNSSPKQQTSQPKQRTTIETPISKLSLVAIGLTLGLGGFLYYHAHEQAKQQTQTIEQLQLKLSSLEQSISQSLLDFVNHKLASLTEQQNQQLNELTQKVDQQLTTQAQSQQKFMSQISNTVQVAEQNIEHLNERIAALSTSDNNIWLISQANYYVNLAGRKIWNDQDYTTARLLLKNADMSLAQANDPSLLPARQAINQDIASLATISFTDLDGIVLKLMNLTNTINQLPLVDHYHNIEMTADNNEISVTSQHNANDTSISFSIADWYQNLVKSSQSFFNKFIQVEKYDSFNECITNAGQDKELLNQCQEHNAILLPEQAPYLRENIKLKLLIAAQAVPRHQETIYQHALNDAIKWTNIYFDKNASAVQAFSYELKSLQQQTISNENVPQQLASYNELNKLMQVRVRAMLAN